MVVGGDSIDCPGAGVDGVSRSGLVAPVSESGSKPGVGSPSSRTEWTKLLFAGNGRTEKMGPVPVIWCSALAVVIVLFLIQPSTAIYCDEDDCYDLLGVTQSANTSEIKKSYYKLSLKHHPDKNPDPESKKLFVKVANVYEILKDEETRKQYDYAIEHPEEGFKLVRFGVGEYWVVFIRIGVDVQCRDHTELFFNEELWKRQLVGVVGTKFLFPLLFFYGVLSFC